MSLRLLASASITLLLLPFFADAVTCPNLYRNLSIGMSGQDVVSLQAFLIAQGDLAAGNNTGYFGRLTEAAVKKWQGRNGVVSAGTAATTGYGAVGPRTRAKIASVCRGIISSPFSATPTSGATPLQVTFNSPASCVQPYSIDFGDGQSSGQIVVPPCNLDGSRPSLQKNTYHTYTAPGTYTAKIVDSYRPTNTCNPPNAEGHVLCTTMESLRTTLAVTITVTGTSNTPLTDKVSCERIGGQWGWVYDSPPNTPPYCNMPTSDAGKSCTDSSQCQSFCQAPLGTTPGAPAIGTCYGWEKKDCAFSVEDGMAITAIMCS